uniref:HMG box domain-containing protein n=2 Tax=Alexandrium monilatum TaxID=311494 RepID=A0A7S4SZI9_9DINO
MAEMEAAEAPASQVAAAEHAGGAAPAEAQRGEAEAAPAEAVQTEALKEGTAEAPEAMETEVLEKAANAEEPPASEAGAEEEAAEAVKEADEEAAPEQHAEGDKAVEVTAAGDQSQVAPEAAPEQQPEGDMDAAPAAVEEQLEADVPPRQPTPGDRQVPPPVSEEPIEEEPRASPVKDAIEEPDVAAPAAEEKPPQPAPIVNSPEQVLLLVGHADGSDTPQVFRMRSDQPLQRLLATYAKFRELPSDEGLWLCVNGQEKLDPTVTAGALGLSDGVQVTVHGTPAAASGSKANGAAGGESAAPGGASLVKTAGPPKRKLPQEAQRRQRSRREEPAKENPEDAQPKRPPTAYFLWYNEHRQAITTELGTNQVSAAAKVAGERWKALSEEEKAPFEKRVAELKAEYDRAMSDFVARGGVPKRRGKKGQQPGSSQRQKQLKRPVGGAYGQFLRSQKEEIKRSMTGDVQAGDVSREAERRWRDLGEEAKRGYQERFNQKMGEYKAALEDAKAEKERKEIPASPVGLMRSARVTQGAARGWTVSAWRNAQKAVCWKIVEAPSAGRSSRTFRDFKELRRSTDADVYRQLDQMVKPGLLQRLSDRSLVSTARPGARTAPPAAAQPDLETPKRRAPPAAEEDARQPSAALGQKRPRGDGETPDRSERPFLATQVFRPQEGLRPKGQAWTCACSAHLTRHKRCTVSSDSTTQPEIIHLRKSSTTVGRAETCDVMLGSARTPQMLSRCHAVLKCEDGFTLTDQGSVNGCLVNNRSVQGKCMLRNGDVITFGVQTAHPEFDYVFETRRGAY